MLYAGSVIAFILGVAFFGFYSDIHGDLAIVLSWVGGSVVTLLAVAFAASWVWTEFFDRQGEEYDEDDELSHLRGDR